VKNLIVVALMVALSGGCASIPGWMLKAHVETYNTLHPDKPVNENENQP